MPNKRYIRGANFERWVLNKLREQGYDGMRSAGSHSSADLFVWDDIRIAEDKLSWQPIDNPSLYLIQCKTSQERVFNLTDLIWQDEVRELTSLPECFTKVLIVKQYRLITQVVWKLNNSNDSKISPGYWEVNNVFNLR